MYTLPSLMIILLIVMANSIFIPVTRQPYCIIIEQQQGRQVSFFYQATTVVSNLRVKFEPSSNQIPPFQMKNSKNQTKFKDTSMKICFRSIDGSYISVSIDYYTNDVAHLAQLASKSDMYELYSKIIEAGSKIKEVAKNELFEKQRQDIHARIIDGHQMSLKILVASKLAIIVIVAVAQILILKKVLNKGSQGYQPV